MIKVMLVMDDYSELVFVETILKKLGFDVLSLNKDTGVSESLLGFYPDLVISHFKSRSVDGMSVLEKVRKLTSHTRILFLYPIKKPPTLSQDEKAKVDAFLETPIDPRQLIEVISQLHGLDSEVLIDKYARLKKTKMSEADNQMHILKGEAPPQAASEREQRYQKFLDTHPDQVDRVVTRFDLLQHTQELAEASKSDQKLLDEIDQQKRAFVRALYK